MSLCYIGLGSNLGDRLKHLARGVELLGQMGQLLDVSSVYWSKAWGLEDQPDFLNAVALLDTRLFPLSLLKSLKQAEALFYRQATRWGPRELDLDILLFQGLKVRIPQLSVPHPMMHKRAFVSVPLNELWDRGWPRLGCELKPGKGAWLYAPKEAIWQRK